MTKPLEPLVEIRATITHGSLVLYFAHRSIYNHTITPVLAMPLSTDHLHQSLAVDQIYLGL